MISNHYELSLIATQTILRDKARKKTEENNQNTTIVMPKRIDFKPNQNL
jgi:hypothetical protein